MLMARLLVFFALFAVALAAPRDRRQAVLAPNAFAPAIVGAQQTPGGHVTGASASIRIHASPAIQTPVAAPLVVPAAPVAVAAPAVPSTAPAFFNPPLFGTAPVLVPARV